MFDDSFEPSDYDETEYDYDLGLDEEDLEIEDADITEDADSDDFADLAEAGNSRDRTPTMSAQQGIPWVRGPRYRGKPSIFYVPTCSTECMDRDVPMHVDPHHIYWRICDGCDLTVCAFHGAKYEYEEGFASVLCPACDRGDVPTDAQRYRRVSAKFEGSKTCRIRPAEVQYWLSYDRENDRESNDRFWSAQRGHFQNPPPRIADRLPTLAIGDRYPFIDDVAGRMEGATVIRAIAHGARPAWFRGPGTHPRQFIVGNTYVELEAPNAAAPSLFELMCA